MAQNQSTSTTDIASYIRGMVKDTDDSFTQKGAWYHARNLVNYSKDGNEGTISNEPSNTFCNQAPFPIIGAIHLNADRWAIFSTNNTLHEIGVFEEDSCSYTPLRNCKGQNMNQTNCLGFNQNNIIIGVSKEGFDCTFSVYFADKLNPDRVVNIDKAAFVEICVPQPGNPGCLICDCTTDLDCDLLRLAPLVKTPCLRLSEGPSGGSILNGSYYAIVAYVVNSQRVTDYYMPSNTQAIFEHDNVSGSLLVTIDQIDQDHFDYFELVIVRFVNSQTSAKKIGIYSTRQAQISIDSINEALESVPVELIPLRTPNYEKSDGIFEIGNYMVRTGPRSKFDFNYQPLANRITTKWQAVAYPSSYYADGGSNTGYFRDEVYPYFIRWIYDTAERSSSYHIPGRPALASDLAPIPVLNSLDPSEQRWEIVNTSPGPSAFPNITLADGGILISEGNMGYWQSSEIYPDKRPDIFNASAHPWSLLTIPPTQYGGVILDYDLCGKPIRHHKFPDNKTVPHFRTKPGVPVSINATTGIPDPTDAQIQIVVLGVAFDNILPPVDNNGVLIPGIVGYEILRGSREGNKTIIAKGMINNMRTIALDTGEIGLYQNYPYNSLQADPSLASQQNEGESIAVIRPDFGPLSTGPYGGPPYSQNQFTFHSPDTSFNNPFLSSKELKLYGELYGNVTGNFDESPKHPKEKLISDVAFAVAALIGVGAAIIALKGKSIVNYNPPFVNENTPHGSIVMPAPGGFIGPLDPAGTATILGVSVATETAFTLATTTYNTAVGLGATLGSLLLTGDDTALDTYRATLKAISLADPFNLIQSPATPISTEVNEYNNLPKILQVLTHIPIFSHYWTLGTDAAMELILSMVPYTQYALRYTSHGFSNQYAPATPAIYRFTLTNALYLNDGIQDFGQNSNAKINNINRGKTVAIQTLTAVANPVTVVDNTTQTVGTSQPMRDDSIQYLPIKGSFHPDNAKIQFNTATISHYAGIKQRMRNQYGQLHGIIQVPVSTCLLTPTNPIVAGTVLIPNSGPLFNGDIYIGRFTEKNTFFYFWDWLYDQPDGFEFNYQIRQMHNYARYWADFTKFDSSDFLTNFLSFIISLNFSGVMKSFPSGRHSLDGGVFQSGWQAVFSALLRVTNRYFYLFQSGVRDFLVESEINVDLRDWEEPIEKRFYDTRRGFTDLRQMFDPKIIKSGNFYKYDQSLSISRMFNNFFSWGNLQDREYDPFTAEFCYVYYKKRVIYSLPQNLEAKKDYWRVFLANNYKDFKSQVTAVAPINKNGAMFFFYEQAPIMYQGVDTLQTDLGTKITIGDGGLFNQPEQAVVNADESYEYGSCQNRLSVANTPVGLFWIGQNQGKIFKYSGAVSELSAVGMKFWFSRFLPYQLTLDFPNFDITDNPVAGIGCQSIFNNRDTILYFAKKDYKLKSQYTGQIVYVPGIGPGTGFLLGALPIKLGDPQYFEDASWTLSFDPKTNSWQSFHDWHPDLMLPGKSTHLTTKLNGIWKHTDNQTSFCKFYGIDYPFEIDYISQTGQTVQTIRSIEYFMEAHIYKQDKTDFYHVLDYNFDHAVIYNSEQVSGTLILNDTPKNNVAGRLLYPIINPTSIDILYDKVEQKYRFNQFWDITADRGEYTFPNVQRNIWQTESNGYIRSLNPANLNYNKLEFQRKKFRHYANHIRLYKNISNNIKILMRFANNKELVSFR